MKNRSYLILVMLVLVSFSSWAEITGEQIITNVYNRESPDDLKGNLTMVLENKRGDKRVREINQFIKSSAEEEKQIMFFTSPADVRDTSFMNWSFNQEGKDDSQWIYLPALKKVKRISSSGSNDYFMGSDFTYDDLGDRQPSEDTHTLLKTEDLDGDSCYVVESRSKDEDYMYSRTLSWVSKDKWIGLKKEFYDEDGELLKILTVEDLNEVEGFWIISSSIMKNVQKDQSTLMELSNVEINRGIEDKIFTERVMTRGF